MDSLEEVARAVRSCTDCPLHQGRANAVPGEGNPFAELMFIGEGPGFHEDKQGRPFVGQAGHLLEGLLASIGTNRDNVFIANMIKCRPPGNRDPEPSEMAACAKYLDRQIELVNPKIIVTLGRFSLGRFFPGESITRARGRLREKDGRLIFPVVHPAAALRRPELRSTMVEDFRAIAAALETAPEPGEATLHEPGNTILGIGQEQPSTTEQMDLFGAPPPSSPSTPAETPADDGQEESGEENPQQLSMF